MFAGGVAVLPALPFMFGGALPGGVIPLPAAAIVGGVVTPLTGLAPLATGCAGGLTELLGTIGLVLESLEPPELQPSNQHASAADVHRRNSVTRITNLHRETDPFATLGAQRSKSHFDGATS